ncbi:hypothetical protein ACIA8G_31710 [Lentzea sp. NPDC051213]|uniref:hypothetical protein n=1 Tax=Lentzea sp. NPDC051213 TaxID=3364126 RepID=UPI00378E2FB8
MKLALVLTLTLLAPVPTTTSAWQDTPVPLSKGDINAVATAGPDAWATGYQLTSLRTLESVLLRWDGKAWQRTSPLPAQALPKAIAVNGPSDIWLVGRTEDLHAEALETVHWNGTSWSSHSLAVNPVSGPPDVMGGVMPEAVAAHSGKAWVAGRAWRNTISTGVPAIQSWDGTKWQHAVLPEVGPGELVSLTALSPNDVWAAGVAYSNPQTPLLFHFDGVTWRRVEVPGQHTWLSGVTAFAANDVWVVGGKSGERGDQPFASHWDGRKWTVSRTPRIGDGRLKSVARTADGRVWAVGGKGDVSVALQWHAPLRTWVRVQAPNVVVRGAVAGGNALWTAGISRTGDLVPAIARR